MAFEWCDDISPATWWTERLHPFAADVGSVLPEGFPAYARVFHPVNEAGAMHTWAAVAAENSRVSHAEMQFHEIARPPGAPRPPSHELDHRVDWGSLPTAELASLSELLGHYTSTPKHCWCCVWEGYSQLHGGAVPLTQGGADPAAGRIPPLVPADVERGPRVETHGRAYYLLRGPVGDLPALAEDLGDQSPNIWWPDDRTWCVATEIDFAWTYVGGSGDAIEAILAAPGLEALAATPTDQIGHASDTRNATLD